MRSEPISAAPSSRPRPPTDGQGMDDLLMAVAHGDCEAFDQLYRAAFTEIVRLARRVLVDHAQSEEIAQEVLASVWTGAYRFDPRLGSGRSWLATITRRRAIDRVRSAQAARTRDDLYLRERPELAADAAHVAVARLTIEALAKALRSLPAEQRDLLVQAHLAGVPYRELARRSNIPIGTVKSRVNRAVSELRRHLSSDPT